MHRFAKEEVMNIRQRLALFHGSSISAAEGLAMEHPEITFDLLMRSGVRANNLITAGQGPTALLARGALEASHLRKLGFDSLHLCDADFCNEASMAYGAGAVTGAFLVSAADAVNLAGTEAMHILDLQPRQLLECCAGFPGEAEAVLSQLPRGASLHGVPCRVALDAGLRATALMRCGYGLNLVVTQMSPRGPELHKLGYS